MITTLIENAIVEMMRSLDFKKYEIKRFLEAEADGEIVSKKEYTFIAVYKYSFATTPEYSVDSKYYSLDFDVKVIGIKSNILNIDNKETMIVFFCDNFLLVYC